MYSQENASDSVLFSKYSYMLEGLLEGITESFWGSRQKIHIDGLSNHLYSLWKQQASSLFRNINYCFLNQRNVGHHTRKVTKKGVDLFIKYLVRPILCRFLQMPSWPEGISCYNTIKKACKFRGFHTHLRNLW